MLVNVTYFARRYGRRFLSSNIRNLLDFFNKSFFTVFVPEGFYLAISPGRRKDGKDDQIPYKKFVCQMNAQWTIS
jgi:hypothetical protein